MAATLSLAFLAGLVSILSPCVLPLLPLVLGAAAGEHRFGPLALASGVALSFVGIGLFAATIGYGIGLNAAFFRSLSAALMIAFAILLLLPNLQSRLAMAGGPVSNWIETRFGGLSGSGLAGQFSVGLLLGAVWSPCVGPTLGAASLLAAQGQDLAQVGLTMLVFGIGAALPLLALGAVSRQALSRLRGRMLSVSKGAKTALAFMLLIVGFSIASGYDRQLESFLVEASPDWLTNLTTRF